MLPLYHVTSGHRLLPGGVLEDLPACGRVALAAVRRLPLIAGRVPMQLLAKCSGQSLERGEPLICFSCGSPVRVDWLSYDRPLIRQPIVNRSDLKERWDAV